MIKNGYKFKKVLSHWSGHQLSYVIIHSIVCHPVQIREAGSVVSSLFALPPVEYKNIVGTMELDILIQVRRSKRAICKPKLSDNLKGRIKLSVTEVARSGSRRMPGGGAQKCRQSVTAGRLDIFTLTT